MNSNQYPAQGQAQYSDEIDLVALCAKVWVGKWKIVGTALFCLALGVVYLVVTPKYYLLETTIAPPLDSDLRPIQPPEAGSRYALEKIKVARVFELLKGYLQSGDKRQEFWVRHRGLLSGEIPEEELGVLLRFEQGLKVSDTSGDDDSISLSLTTSDPDKGVKDIRAFLEFANKQVFDELASRLAGVVVIQKDRLLEDILRAREQYQIQLSDEISALEEALNIAVEMNVVEIPYRDLANVEASVVNSGFVQGTKALSAQIEALKLRKGKDSFVPGLRALQNQLKVVEDDLAHLQEHAAAANAFQVLKPLSRPLQAEGPKKALVLLLSVVFGGFLGLLWLIVDGLRVAILEREKQEG